MSHPVDGWAFAAAAAAAAATATAEITLSSWLSVARIYQYAAAIYCIAALLDHDHQNDTEKSDDENHHRLQHAKRSCHAMLVAQLRYIKDTCDQLRKLVIWPLVIAGIISESDDDDDVNTRRFVLDELAWTSKTLGIVAPLLGREFLQRRVWAGGSSSNNNFGKRGRMGKWGDLFDRAYLFAM